MNDRIAYKRSGGFVGREKSWKRVNGGHSPPFDGGILLEFLTGWGIRSPTLPPYHASPDFS
jgi:hypothetical protein